MNLWFSCVFLVVGLVLSSSAQSNDECETIVKPMSTFTPRWGRWNWMAGYSDNSIYDDMYRDTQSQWIDFNKIPNSPDKFDLSIGIKHPSYCKYGSHPMTIVGNSAIGQKSNFTCTYHSLPTCECCLLYHITAVNNMNLIDNSNPTTKEELRGFRALYLNSRDLTIKESDLEHFKKQAHCLGFKGEPTFVYDTKDPFCDKNEETSQSSES